MIVNFVSECEKNALSKTAQVLDGFANRIGEKTWQSVMTEDGVHAVKQQLRRIATKHTAVLCYALRDQIDAEWVWIVGNHHKFITPSSAAIGDFINTPNGETWPYLPLIKSITAIAALFHDWGKASDCFQDTLHPNASKPEIVSHEWISCLAFNAFINGDKTDSQWLERLSSGEIDSAHILSTLANNSVQRPFKDLPPVACLIGWLILSHHRLPLPQNDWRSKVPPNDFKQLLSAITADFGYRQARTCLPEVRFAQGLLSQQLQWNREVKKWALKLQQCIPLATQTLDNDTWRLILHHARLALMLSDHVSLLQAPDANWPSTCNVFTQIDKNTGHKIKALDEHITCVLENALKMVHYLPAFETTLPCVQAVMTLSESSHHIASSWQEKAVAAIKTWREESAIAAAHYGFFGINMVSDHGDKISANAKILRALSPDFNCLRGIFALGTKHLTLQTGEQYRRQLGLDSFELAIVTGTKMPTTLYKSAEVLSQQAMVQGHVDSLLNDEVDFDGTIFEGEAAAFFHEVRDKKFLYAPVLACSIESFITATQTASGHHYILPSLRLMSSDLVLDEIDCLDGDALIALGRLIHLAGMLGRKVVLSSACLTPDVAEGYFSAYQSGWQIFSRSRGLKEEVGCAWIDDCSTQVMSMIASADCHLTFRHLHAAFVHQGAKQAQPPVRHPREDLALEDFHSESLINIISYQHIRRARMHAQTSKKVSFGLLNMASITSCIDVAERLMQYEWPEDMDVKIMLHHRQQVLLMRNEQEQHLDEVLYRGNLNRAFEHPIIATHLAKSTAQNVIYLLVTNMTTELGGDYAFDWSMIEPSCVPSAQVATQSLIAYDKKGAENLAGWLNSCWFLTALPQTLTPFAQDDKTTKCHLLPLKDHAWQFVEKDQHGKFVTIDGLRHIETRELSQHHANRLWLASDYTHVIEKLAAKKSTAISDIALRYSEMALPKEAQNGLLYCSAFGMMAKRAARSF